MEFVRDPGWWRASDGKYYPPEDELFVAVGWTADEGGQWHPPDGTDLPTPGWWLGNDGTWYSPSRHPNPHPDSPLVPTNPVEPRSTASAEIHQAESAGTKSLGPGTCIDGHAIRDEDRFCGVCGKSRVVAQAPASSTAPITTENASSTSTSGHRISPGWYPSPTNKSEKSYWDGTKWSSEDIGPAPVPVADPSIVKYSDLDHVERRRVKIMVGAVVAVVLVLGIAFAVHGLLEKSQSYKAGWDAAIGQSDTNCNSDTAPNGDNQGQWVQGCNDASNTANNGSLTDPPTTYPGDP